MRFTVGGARPAQPRSVTTSAVLLAFACPRSDLTLTARDGTTLADDATPMGDDRCRVTLTPAARTLPRLAPVVVTGLHERWAFLLLRP